MTTEDIAKRLKDVAIAEHPCPSLSYHAVKSIENGTRNYPVKNLFCYCADKGLKIELEDMATEDLFYPPNVMALHRTLLLLMERYDIDRYFIYRQTGKHYTLPKDLYKKDNEVSALSIGTLLAVCSVINCDIRFIKK